MGGQVTLSGQLQIGPKCCGPDDRSNSFINLMLNGGCCAKSYNVATGILQLDINSTGAYIALPGVGAAPGVTHGDTIYFFTKTALLLRLTTDDGAGGSVLSVLPVNGLLILEFNATRFLKLVEVQGAASIEYFVSGQS